MTQDQDAGSPVTQSSEGPKPTTTSSGTSGPLNEVGQGSSPAFTREPTTSSSWIRPGYAVIVVCFTAIGIVVVLAYALTELAQAKAGDTMTADPNAGTIAAIAAAAFSSLTALASAYFGIKVATEQALEANATAGKALAVASQAVGNSTRNGNPKAEDF